TYRAATLAGLATNFFFGMLRASVLIALYHGQSEIAGMTITDAITFTGLTQAAIAFLSLFSWYEVMDSVYTGAVSSDMLKPMNYFNFWLAQDSGRAFASFLLRGLSIMIAYALLFDITVPQSADQWLAFILVLLLSWLVSFSWRFLVNLAAFWTPNALGIARLAFILSWFLSGFFMPLRFFPVWFVRLCYLTPFPYTINAVVEVYLGLVDGQALAAIILAQIAWILLLVLAGMIALRAGVRRLEILGG
ncbi:MAG: ABC-2 family transporter protein, partial [Chloroflexi bacterium]|nr:ABC-2 family transporter protein [Chloroflexota bacterium]